VAWGPGADRFSAERVRRPVKSADAADVEPVLWKPGTTIPRFEYETVIERGDDEQLFRFLRAFLQHGLALLNNVPRRLDPAAIAAARLSTSQASHPDRSFSIMPVGESHHVGETCDDIPLQLDPVYKQAPPDVQMLHVLEPADPGDEDVFVDAFVVIKQLDPKDVQKLRETPVLFVTESGTVSLRGLHPVIAYDAAGRLRGLHYNDQKVIFLVTTPNEAYLAFKRLQQVVRRRENAQVIRVPRDSIVLFDNRRTIHEGRGFCGARHAIGRYFAEDDLKRRYRELARRFRFGEARQGLS
jgi:alpha-ketoglutarate-dependent taurine dioxygenase